MEVIATGRITHLPGQVHLPDRRRDAGAGRRRRAHGAARGAPAQARGRGPVRPPSASGRLPYLPRVIGVVTSPTGAVIRDILHRLEDRFPRHVLVWPVRVQGETCAAEVAPPSAASTRCSRAARFRGPMCSSSRAAAARIEDLWGFNEEIGGARRRRERRSRSISAVGHETDTTLIDYAADMRAPTPTGAAEMVVPVRAELMAAVNDLARRHAEAALRLLERRRSDLRAPPARCRRRTPCSRPSASASISRRRGSVPALARQCAPARRAAAQAPPSSPMRRPRRGSPHARSRLDAVDPRPRHALYRLMPNRARSLKQTAAACRSPGKRCCGPSARASARQQDLTQSDRPSASFPRSRAVRPQGRPADRAREALRQPELQIGARARLCPGPRSGRTGGELGRCRYRRPASRPRIRGRQGGCHGRAPVAGEAGAQAQGAGRGSGGALLGMIAKRCELFGIMRQNNVGESGSVSS